MLDPHAAPPHLRSALFVPAHRCDRLDRARRCGADAVILDLEDSVDPTARDRARQQVRDLVTHAPASGDPAWCVRVHRCGSPHQPGDLDAAVGPGLLAVLLPKVAGPADVRALAAELDAREAAAGLPTGRIRIWPLLESARAVTRSIGIARASHRLAYLGGGTAEGGDLAASVGFRWTPEGLETLYQRSKVLLDARAAGVPYPMTGVVTALDALEPVRRFAAQSRQLGYDGLAVIHPSHVAVANAVFGSTRQEQARARATLAALDAAAAAGEGATRLDGRMLDTAMRAGALQVLARRAADPSPGASRAGFATGR